MFQKHVHIHGNEYQKPIYWYSIVDGALSALAVLLFDVERRLLHFIVVALEMTFWTDEYIFADNSVCTLIKIETQGCSLFDHDKS